MKPEPLPGAWFTVSESRHSGAIQGEACEGCQAGLRLAGRVVPHQTYINSATAIGVAEAIMVSTWVSLKNNRAYVYLVALGATDDAR